MSNIAATLSLNVPAITALCTGQRGSIIYAASGTPTNIYNTYLGNPGLSGDFYVDTATGFYYGPKTTSWPSSPLFALNVPTSAYPLTLLTGTTGLFLPTYGNNTVSPYGTNLGILGGVNNTLSGANSFIIGSNLTSSLSNFTVVNNLSGNVLYDIIGNSILWNTAYTAYNSTSANFTAASTLIDTNSAIWNNAYSSLTATSATWTTGYTSVNSNSANWNTSYNVVSSLAYITYTYVNASSSIIPAHGVNGAPGIASNVNGGNKNYALSAYSSVLGGVFNTASANYSNITGGFSGLATGTYSNIAGGLCNTASGYGTSIGGGTGNIACGYNSSIAAGAYNVSSCCSTFIGGGKNNTASGIRSSVVGGYCNTASGNYSFVAGGSGNNTAGYTNTFILGSNLSATQANTTYTNNILAQGNASINGNVTVVGTVSANGPITGTYYSTSGSLGNYTVNDRNGGSAYGAFFRQNGVNYLFDSVAGNVVAYTSGGNVGINTVTPAFTLHTQGNAYTSSETIAGLGSSVANFRAIDSGNQYGFMIRNDGTNTYMLFTAAGSPLATWNSLRPLTISNATGNVTMANSNVSIQHSTGNIFTNGTIAGGTPLNNQTSNYTVQDSDCGGIIYFNSGTAVTCYLPNPNTVRNGYQVTVIQAGAGQVTFNANGNTLNQSYGLLHTSAQWSAATLAFNSTFGWTLFGDLA